MTPAQCRAARSLLGIEQEAVAASANVARATLIDFEKGRRVPRQSTIDAIRTALEFFGVEFIAENDGGAGVRLKERKKNV